MPILLRPKKAFTLIEMIVALCLLAILSLAAFSFTSYIKNLNVMAENYSQAREFLVQELEILRAYYRYDDAALAVTPPNTSNNAPLSSSVLSKYGGARSYTVTETQWPVGTVQTHYKESTATVTWNDGVSRALSLAAVVGTEQ